MLATAVCAAKRGKFCKEIGKFIIPFGLGYSQGKGVIVYGDEEVWKFWKDSKRNYKESNNKEVNKEIITGMYQPKSILKDF
ncbi:hypothetical protein FBQ80_13105 [Candidatus Brocadia sp. AMX2]|uniref:Reverse gyrase n=1 Tax=Candidatus Brocadia sinica JPN1 TaxID=1197129 RepID=A0ABQ0JV62_9BACT|nr:hypothetical protein [Candidatus Brocadia sp. AMX2]GAN32492.1 reverse gyrase [Candidatus Brocadia sinica JPN1]GIK13968.1 MAG: hypothetical protein BroJett002_26750 [Candidatus Brocadia sinica]GJQ18590.1 MAG: hypothetical protein HBSIN01_25490 [Candidatus Brocadia sinica]